MNKQIYLFRHGQTDWNLESKMQGHKDIPLNQTGLNEAIELKHKVQAIHKNLSRFDVYSSDLKRAKKTAQIVFPESTIIDDVGLREIHIGEMEGMSRDSVPFAFQKPDPNYRFPGGESISEHSQRVISTVERLAKKSTVPLFISTHGGSMARLLEQAQDYIPKRIINCELVHIEWSESQFYFKEYLT